MITNLDCNIPSYGYNGFTDGLTILQPESDAVTATWGFNISRK